MMRTVILLLSLAAGGCATIFQKSQADVLVTANVAGAEVTVDGIPYGAAPQKIRLRHKEDHLVKVFKAGYQEHVCHLQSSVSTGWILLNVLFWPGLIIDASTGDWRTLDKRECIAYLQPLPEETRPPPTPVAAAAEATSRTPPAGNIRGAFVAVFDIQDKSGRLSAQEIDSLTEYLASRLAEDGLFHVIPRAELKNRLLEQKKESYRSCFEESCQIEIGREMAAQKSLSLSVAAVGNSCLINAALYDLKKAATDATAASRGGCSVEELINHIEEVVIRLRRLAH